MIRKNPLAVCFVTSSLVNESFGGVQNFVLQFSQWLSKQSIKVIVISNSFQAFVKSVFFDGNHVTQIKRSRLSLVKYTPSIIRPFIFTFMSFLEIVRQNKKFSFSIIHAQDVLNSGFAGTIAHKLFRIPLIVHAHGPSPYFFEATPEATKLQRILARCLVKAVINNSNLLISTDTHTKNLFLPFIDKAQIICIPTPINTKAYSRKKETYTGRTPNEGLILGFIGRLSPQKNLRTLLNAFASARTNLDEPLKLVIVGDGPERSLLMREARRLKVNEEVVFNRAVTESKKIELLNSFDIFLMPSFYEGCPVALLEAMASGKAIISSNIPSIREIVRHYKEAILVNPYNVEELRQAILTLCKNPSIRTALGNKAQDKAKLYDASNIFDHLLETYKKIICHADKQKHQTLTLSIIEKVLIDNAKQIFAGSAQDRALRDVWLKSRYLSNLFKVASKLSFDLRTARILDVGCSKCDILLAMQKLGISNLTGLNLFPFDLGWLSSGRYYAHYFGESSGKIKYVVCDVDAESFPFKDSSYDVVLLIDVLEHLHNPKRVLLECYRVLSPGGLFVVTTPNMANLKNRIFAIFGRSIYYPLDEWLGNGQRINNGRYRRFIGHVREYTMQEINQMLSRYGFQVLLTRYYASHLRDKGILYGLYRFFERLYPRLRYHMLIIGRKPV